MRIHPDILAAHAQFGGDLESMQKLYAYPDILKALKNLAFEMRYMLNTHPGMDGGLYRIRLEEAESAIAKAEGRQ